MSISIPQSIITSLQASFDNEVRKIAKDAAKILKVPEKDVMQIVRTIPKIQFKIIDDDEIPSTCPVFKRGETFLRRCRTPCILGTGRCIDHQKHTQIPKTEPNTKCLTRVRKQRESDPDIWCDEETRNIHDSLGNKVGIINEDDCVEIYEYEE